MSMSLQRRVMGRRWGRGKTCDLVSVVKKRVIKFDGVWDLGFWGQCPGIVYTRVGNMNANCSRANTP